MRLRECSVEDMLVWGSSFWPVGSLLSLYLLRDDWKPAHGFIRWRQFVLYSVVWRRKSSSPGHIIYLHWQQFCRQGEGLSRETVDIFMSLFFGFFKHINAFYLVKNILGNYRIRLNTVIHLHYCEHKIYCDDQGLIWYMYLNNSFHFFWKYVWVKKYVKICVMLFENWKHVFKIIYRTAPENLESGSTSVHSKHYIDCKALK